MIIEMASKVNSLKKVARCASHAVEQAKSLACNYLEKMREFKQCWQWLVDEIIAKKEKVIKMKDII